MSKTLIARIREALEARALSRDAGVGIEEFLARRDDVSSEDRDAILRTLDGIDAATREIRDAGDRDVWLTNRIQSVRGQLSPEDLSIFAGTEVEEGVLTSSLARGAQEQVASALVVGFGSQADSKALDSEFVELREARSFFERGLGDLEDRDTTASVASAVLPLLRKATPGVRSEAVAAAVDLGAQAVKAAAKATLGQVSANDAVAHVLDRGAAAVGTLISGALPEAAAAGGGWIGAMLGAFVGLAPAGARIGSVLGRVAGHAVAKAVGAGVARVVKEVGLAAGRAVSQFAENLRAGANRIFAQLGF